MGSPRFLSAAHAHHGHHIHAATLDNLPASGAPAYGQVYGFAFLDHELRLEVLGPGIFVSDVGRQVDHLRGYLAVLRYQYECRLMGAQSHGVEVEGYVDGGRFPRSDAEHLLTQGIERRIARHGIELQFRRTRIDKLEGLGLVAAANAVVHGLHAAPIVAHQQVWSIHVDASSGNAVDAEAVARYESEAVVAGREPGNPLRVVKGVGELIGIHALPLVAAVDGLLDGHVGLRVDDGTLVAAVAILQREDDGVVNALNGQRGRHEPVAGSTAAKDGTHGCHAAALRIIVRGYAFLHHKAFSIAAQGQLVVVEVDSPRLWIGDDGGGVDAGACQTVVLRREND